MSDERGEQSFFTEDLTEHIKRITAGKKSVCVTCGIMHVSKYELKLWGSEGEEEYRSHKYEIGSITKTITGILMSEAVLSGKALTTDRLNKWIPELDNDKYWPTIEHLLTHTSGFPADDESSFDEYELEEVNCYINITREKLIQQINGLILENITYRPEYSNIGCATIGLILERIHGKSYKELAYDVLNRYGMSETVVYSTDDIGLPGIGREGRTCSNWKWPESCALAPAGSIISTPEDLLKYGQIILQQEDSAVRLALTPIKQYSPKDKQPVLKIGYFWMNLEDYNLYFHNGGTGCFNTALAIDMKAKTVMIFLSNSYLEEDANFILSELLHLRENN
ncbi:serine hydrolase domain-containing protein [Anaeromicropila herbilytica]|uniref:Beta-lactamase-related domain-containing protein n=1 Tax=Anaeromicropila herbilytica TaxID=2785025 RepID=A0A7R7EHX0_9FIRM|nr:serine hydrolase domain-containing protein [Anaeromicropila herbilytica]BCN29049.1 hypothetical protein bsdtb5_03440 [Anaeromicropila herbilytica]